MVVDRQDDSINVVPLGGRRPNLKIDVGTVHLQPLVNKDEAGRVVSQRIPDDLMASYDRLKEHEGWPYETLSDFIRDAFYMGLEALSTKLGISDHEVQNTINVRAMKKKSEFYSRERARARVNVHHLREQVIQMLEVEDLDETYRVLVDYWGRANNMQMAFWRRWYVKAFVESKAVRVAARLLRKNGYRLPPDMVRELWTPASPTS